MRKEDRASRWINLLQIDTSRNPLKECSEAVRHSNPAQVQIDCAALQKQWPMFQETELKEYLELLLAHYCKEHSVNYQSGLHEVLAAFFLVGFSGLKTVYAAFKAFVKRMMPRVFSEP